LKFNCTQWLKSHSEFIYSVILKVNFILSVSVESSNQTMIWRIFFLFLLTIDKLSGKIMFKNMNVQNVGRVLNVSGNYSNQGANAVLNFQLKVFEPVKKVLISIKITVPQNEDDTEYGKHAFNIQVDLEKLMNGKNTELITKTIVNIALQTFRPRLTLPTKEKLYLLQKFTVPGLLFSWNAKFLIKIGFHAKPVKSNKLILMTNIEIEGEIKI
jgi:hypothetical protein